MKKSFLPVLILAVLGAIFPNWRLDGAPLKEADLCERAEFFMHVDFDALRAGKGWAKIAALIPQTSSELADFQKATGFDVRRNLTGITASSSGLKKSGESGSVVLRHNTSANAKLAAWLAKQPGVKPQGDAVYALSSRNLAGGLLPLPASNTPILVDFSSPRVVLFAPNADELALARKRLKTPASSKNAPPAFFKDFVKSTSKVSPVFIGYYDAKPGKKEKGEVIDLQIQQGAWLAGWKNDALKVDLHVQFTSAEAAKSIGASLFTFSDDKVKQYPALGKVKATTDAKMLRVSAESTIEDLANMLEISPKAKPATPKKSGAEKGVK